jgi:cyclic pyranopterin phosphate synthase
MLIDRYRRIINYIRVSITDYCNLKCIYCTPYGGGAKLHYKEILRYEEILRIINTGIRLGISKVRITGGEPLARKDVHNFLYKLMSLEGLSDVSLTTNGVMLKENINRIKDAGIKRINISIDTLHKEKFQKITGYDYFHQVREGINLALKKGFNPVKLNVVVLPGINDDELTDFARLTFDHPLHIRFIEYMPMGTDIIDVKKQLLSPEIKARLAGTGEMIPVANEINDGPVMRYKYKGAAGEIGFISPISNHFCSTCNRLRLTASGHLRPCLLSDRQVDIKTPLRSGASDQEIADIFLKAVSFKPFEHHLTADGGGNGQMRAIGG